MTGPIHLRPRAPTILLLAAFLLIAAPNGARAASQIIAARLGASSLSAEYGSAVASRDGGVGGTYLIPTGTGIEARGSATGGTLFGSFRTAGQIAEVAWSGRTAYLMAGDRGIVAVDASDSTNLVAIGGHDHLGAVEHGAFAGASATLAAASDSTLYFLRETAPGALSLLDTRAYKDGRVIVRVRARSDSFLVVSQRANPVPRVLITLYRARSGAAPESLWEVPTNGIGAADLAWPDGMAFLAIGNGGVLPFDTTTRLLGSAVPVSGGKFVRALDADAGSLVAVGEARTYAQFSRSGPKGETLINEVDRLTAIEPSAVSIIGNLAVISETDQTSIAEPDEVGQSEIEIRDVTLPAQPSVTATAGDGRVRRAVIHSGLAYVADYTGGLRVYRAGSADTSLVGVLPPAAGTRVYDLALDPIRHRVFLAAGLAGLVVVDVTDPTSPAALASLVLPGSAGAVSVVDSGLVVVARRGGSNSGVTFVDVSAPALPSVRGSVNYPFVQDPRALAVKDTIAFVADHALGVLSVRFGDPDAPSVLGPASGSGARDLDLSGTLLLVGLRDGGVQLVDVSIPTSPNLRSTLPTPPTIGVAQLGQTGLALLGGGGALAIDMRDPDVPRTRGVIAVPGFARDAAWVDDTLLVAASFGLERYRASALIGTDPALVAVLDADAVRPRARISWTAPTPPGAIGWDVYRDSESSSQSPVPDLSVRVNESLLGLAARSVLDEALDAGAAYRYRLEAFFPDGSSLKVAEGMLSVHSISGMGRLYPNPYRPRAGQTLTAPYRVLSADGGKPIHLRVYEPSGRLVRDVLGYAPAGGGFGSLAWDGRDSRGRLLADGVYFIHLDGPGIDGARHLVLLR